MAPFMVGFDIGLRDLVAILCKAKSCPICGTALKRRFERKKGNRRWHFGWWGIRYGTKTIVRVFYDCRNCNASLLPRDLLDRHKAPRTDDRVR